MTYQVNMTTNSGDGFTEEELEQVLRSCASAAAPPLEVCRGENDALELRGQGGLLATLCPAGREPFDYLLVDFMDKQGWEGAIQIQVVAAMAERLDLSILELESRLEYSPKNWAVIRGRYHSPDPARRTEARQLELDREIEFFERRGLPYNKEEAALLRSAVEAVTDEELQRLAQEIRDRKKREDRPDVPIRGRRYTDAPARRWWPFGNRRV